MPRELGLPKYFNFAETEPGTVCVDKGRYAGPVEGKFGTQHKFVELDDHTEVVLGGGSLNWRVENGYIVEGEYYRITFEGKGKMEKGAYVGKEVNNFKVEAYDREELGLAPVSVDATPEVPAAAIAAEGVDPALNDLE